MSRSPFLGKSFQTSISAWVTPLSLLEARRVERPGRSAALGYLRPAVTGRSTSTWRSS